VKAVIANNIEEINNVAIMYQRNEIMKSMKAGGEKQ
jgi:hypothetical protein